MKDFATEIAESLVMEREEVEAVLNEFLLLLHRRMYEYKGLNGDYIGEELHNHLDAQGFFHLLGFLDTFSERYDWDEESMSQYLPRLRSTAHWRPFVHQTEGWSKQSK